MQELSVFWLRVAAALYSVGLLHAFWTMLKREETWFRPALWTFATGSILHLVSLVDRSFATGHFPAENTFETLSLCGFLLGVLFLFAYFRYQFSQLSVALFPLVFGMTLAGVMGTPVEGFGSVRVRNAWLLVHVLVIIAGYAALLIAAAASIFYLVQERALKEKRAAAVNLPALMTLDGLMTSSMGLGFVLMTLGVFTGSAWAFVESGTQWISDPKILLSLATWLFYLVLMYLRANSGWRGRKAAITTLSLLGFSVITWAAHPTLSSAWVNPR
jgi:ABC-type uncharacterized transport system permease subunit